MNSCKEQLTSNLSNISLNLKWTNLLEIYFIAYLFKLIPLMLSNPWKSSFRPDQWFFYAEVLKSTFLLFSYPFFLPVELSDRCLFSIFSELILKSIHLIISIVSEPVESFSADSLIEFLIRSRRRELWLSLFNESSGFLLPHISSNVQWSYHAWFSLFDWIFICWTWRN